MPVVVGVDSFAGALPVVTLNNSQLRGRVVVAVLKIDIGLGRALCARITYVGELGYELFVPVEYVCCRSFVDIHDAHFVNVKSCALHSSSCG